ncbi:MAG: FlaA locus kDa protein [Rhodospirillaceae bacterium]|nr:MAG: FlaA locus kDa protein [Rhodospirillaceae bacterium]
MAVSSPQAPQQVPRPRVPPPPATARKASPAAKRKPVVVSSTKGLRLRLLPIVIFVAALTMTVRLNGISTQARAQPSPPAAAVSPQPAEPREEKMRSARRGDENSAGAMLSQNEIDVLQKLAERREILEIRAQELDSREALLRAAEARIEGKIHEIKTLEQTIEKLIARYNPLEENKIKSLVNIYEKMKPKDAARIFNELEMPTLMAVVEHMKDAKTAPIMAEMDSARAKALTMELAARNRLPFATTNLGEQGGGG